MAPRNRRGRRGRQRSGRRSSRGIIETFTFSVAQGNTTDILVSTLTSRPPRSNFRPIWLEVDVCGYEPGTTTVPGFLAPVGCQINFCTQSDGETVSTSRLMLAGAAPKKLRTYYPRSQDWWPFSIVVTTKIAQISAVCVGNTSANSGYLRGIGRMMIIVQEEDCVASCPTIGDVIPIPNRFPVDQAPSTSTTSEEFICPACFAVLGSASIQCPCEKV